MNEPAPQSANLMSVSINQLITHTKEGQKYCFLIPSYQRGYRWEKDQIVRLLDDLYEFKTTNNDNGNAIYCLQPVVVKPITPEEMQARMGEKYSLDTVPTVYYEVVDGQQRLTTIYIILRYLYQYGQAKLFGLEYERDAKTGFSRRKMLQNLNGKVSLVPRTVDEHYFIGANDAIRGWVDNMRNSILNIDNKIEDAIIDSTIIIWYELSDPDADCYQIFRNINNGKIPLTNAELVKAMLLSEQYYDPDPENKDENDVTKKSIIRSQQERFARLWDDIQHAIENDNMWSFITGNCDFETPTRIDFLLKLIVYSETHKNIESDYGLFNFFEGRLTSQGGNDKYEKIANRRKYIESVFERIRTTFRTIQDWYDTPHNFNFIGMIMTYQAKTAPIKTLSELMEYYNTKTREQFKLYLWQQAADLISKIRPDNIGYDEKLASATEQLEAVVPEESIAIKTDGAEDDDNGSKESIVINYHDNSKQIEQWLMLFNILELNDIDERFDFTMGKSGWTVEHIKAQSSEVAKSDDWLDYIDKEQKRIKEANKNNNPSSFTEILDKIDTFITNYNGEKTDDIETELKELVMLINKEVDGFDEVDEHRLGNLALLDRAQNSKLSNSQFYEKREKMLSTESKKFPYATRRVFLKVYSNQTLKMDFSTWRKEDFDSYLKKQYNRLTKFHDEIKKLKEQLDNNGGTQ